LHLSAYSRQAKKYAIEGAADGGIDIEDRSGYTAALKPIEEFTRPAEDEKDKDYIAQT